jgi:exopolysaccharide biosynthesis polyprenyl glycosylphosphotransferase
MRSVGGGSEAGDVGQSQANGGEFAGMADVGAPPDRVESPLLVEALRMLDAVSALAAAGLVFLLVNASSMPRGLNAFLLQRISLKNLAVAAVLLSCWRAIFFLFGLYDPRRRPTASDEARRLVAACFVGSVPLLAMPLVSNTGWFRPWYAVAVWVISSASTITSRWLLRLGVRSSAGRGERRRVIIVGSGPRALRVHNDLCCQRASTRELIGFVDTNSTTESQVVRQRLLGPIDQLERILMGEAADEVIVALPTKSCYAAIQQTISVCERAGVQVTYLADVFQTRLARPQYERSNNTPVVAMKVVDDDPRRIIKRIIDVVGAATGLVVLAPLLAVVAVAVKVTSPGPVFYIQARHGLRRRCFRMLKFRTMVVEADALQASLEAHNEARGPVFKIANDPRVTPIGRFLRRSSLDELPQLVNVLKGDMSLVGPRPLPQRDVAHFDESWLLRRFSVPPGLTGLWQISGRSALGFDDWMALDLRYIDGWSLALDVKILLKTIPAVITGRGAR